MFTFVGGRPSLDLTATVMFRHHEEPVELLAGPADFAEWALQAGLLQEPIKVSPRGLLMTREIREAIYTLVRDRLLHRVAQQGDEDLLNAVAAAPPLGLALQNGVLQRFGSLAQLHSTVARDALELVGGSAIYRVKECSGEDCSRLYLDSSRNETRRWCGMRQCGDRVKSASYRARRRSAPPE